MSLARASTTVGVKTKSRGDRRVHVHGLAAAAVVYTLLIAAVCLWDGWSIPSAPHSNLRFDGDGYRVNLVASGDVLDGAGVLTGDEIVALNGHEFARVFDLPDLLRQARRGEQLTFTVLRDGRLTELTVTAWRNLSSGELFRLLIPMLALIGLGSGVYAARPRVAGMLLFLLFCLSSAINLACQATLFVGTGPLLRLLTFSYTMLSLPSAALLLHFLLVFPVRGRVQRLLMPMLPLAYSTQLALGLYYYVPTLVPNLYHSPRLTNASHVLVSVFGISVVACYLLSTVSLAGVVFSKQAYRTRQQAKLLLAGFVLLSVLQICLYELPLRLWSRSLVDVFSYSLFDLVIAGSVAAAIVVHRMFDINVLLRHGLVYGTASFLVATVFVATVGGLGWLAEKYWPTLSAGAIAVGAAIAALVFHPVRLWTQESVDRVLYRRRYDYRRALTEITGRLATILGMNEALRYLRLQIEKLVEPSWLELVVHDERGAMLLQCPDDGHLRPLEDPRRREELASLVQDARTAVKTAPDALFDERSVNLVVPIIRGDGVLGGIVLGQKIGELPYLAEDRDFLTTLASVAATIIERGRYLAERSERERLALVGTATSAVVHELKNPLAAIKSTAAVLRRRLGGDQRGQELTQIIESEMDRLQDHVLNVLSWVRPGTFDPLPVTLGELVSQTLKIVRAEFQAGGVEIELAEELASGPDGSLHREECDDTGAVDVGRVTIRADPERLRQLLLNLLVNAREAMPDGGRVVVRLRACPDDGREIGGVAVIVEDSGRGFAPEQLDRVFEPFYTTKRLGTGLGLANVRKIAEDHGGEISAGNRPEGGAWVRVLLPCQRGALP